MKKTLAILTAGVLLIAGGTTATAGGSDSPTPYTVDEAGITLPAGDTFQAHGHVNIKTEAGGEARTNIHFDPNNDQPGGAWIGETFLPWSAFGLKSGDCVTWVQISHYSEHHGEGGQEPICIGEPEPEVKHGATSSQSDFCDSPLNGTRIFLTTVTTWTEVEGETVWSDPVTTIDTVTDPTCDYEHPEPEPEADVATTECLPSEGLNARGECVTPTFTG